MRFRFVRSTPARASGARAGSLLAALALVLLLGVSGSASATSMYRGGHDGLDLHGLFPDGLPGLSLRRLVEGGGAFSSRNGEVTFSGFEAETSGIAPRNLDFYRLFPTHDGFKIFTPLVGFLGKDASLSLHYDVDAADGLLVHAIGISFTGFSLFAKSKTVLDAFDGSGELLADLAVWTGGVYSKRDHWDDDWGRKWGIGWRDGRREDRAKLSEAVASLSIDELMKVRTGLFAKNWMTTHHFKTKPIPEPTTALLLGMGLAGLGYAGRRRRA